MQTNAAMAIQRGNEVEHLPELGERPVPAEELSVHPLAATLPDWKDEEDRFRLLMADMEAQGMLEPILIDEEWRILDGRKRWRAALELGWETMACRVTPGRGRRNPG